MLRSTDSSWSKGEGKAFDNFYMDLRERAEDAELSAMTPDEFIRTLIVAGVQNEVTRQELMSQKPAWDLEKTVEYCRSREIAEKEEK